MKKKVLSILLCGVMVCSMLTACGNSDSSNNAGVNDSSKQGKTSATILDVVKYHNDIDYESDYSMMETAKSYLNDKGITYQDDGSGIVSTISDDFLGYRAYYGWDGDDYSIYLTFDSEAELKQAVADVRNYLSSKSDSDFEGTDFCKAVEEKSSRWAAILCWYENGEVFCTDYSQNDEKIYIEATSFNVIGGLSRIRTENEAEYILGDCDSFIEIMVASRSFGVNTDFSSMSDDGAFEAAAAAPAEEAAPAEDTASDTPQSTTSADESSSSDNHDYLVSLTGIYSFSLEDNYFKLTATSNLYDDYTRDPANSSDNIYYVISDSCEFVYYGENIADVKEFYRKLTEEYVEIYDKISNNLDIGDEIDLRVVIESGKIISMEIGYGYDLAN